MKINLLTLIKNLPKINLASPGKPGAYIVHRGALIVTVGIYSIFCLAIPTCLAADKNNRTQNPYKAKNKKIETLPNFHQVHPYLYRGGEPTNKGVDKLKEMGVSTLIDLRAPTKMAKAEKKYAESIGLKYINLPMSDKAPTKDQVSTLLSTIDEGKSENKPVFVHCQHGSDRTGCMIGIWRVKRDGWEFDKTYKEMRKYYFGTKYTQLKNAVKTRASS